MYVEHRALLERGGVGLGQDEVPGPDTRRDGLRERRRVGDEGAPLELEQAGRRLALVAHEAVRIVLEHRQLVLSRDLDDLAAPLAGERPPARILEGRNRVQERRPLASAAQLGNERVRDETLLVHLERYDLGALARENRERAVVRGRLDEHAAGAPGELLRCVEGEALQPSGRQHDARPDRRRGVRPPTPATAHIRSPARRRRSSPRRAVRPHWRSRPARRRGRAPARERRARTRSAARAPRRAYAK